MALVEALVVVAQECVVRRVALRMPFFRGHLFDLQLMRSLLYK